MSEEEEWDEGICPDCDNSYEFKVNEDPGRCFYCLENLKKYQAYKRDYRREHYHRTVVVPTQQAEEDAWRNAIAESARRRREERRQRRESNRTAATGTE